MLNGENVQISLGHRAPLASGSQRIDLETLILQGKLSIGLQTEQALLCIIIYL